MPGGCSSGPNGHGSKRVRDGRELSDREARLRARSDRAEQESSETTQNESDNIAAHHDGLVYACCAAERTQTLMIMASSCCVDLKYMRNQISCRGRSLDPFRPVASTLIFGSLLPRLELIGYS